MVLRSRTFSVKRARVDWSRLRSCVPTRRRLAFPRCIFALVSRVVGLGTFANTVFRTSFFANVTVLDASTGVYYGYLKLGSCFDLTGIMLDIQLQMFDQFASIYGRYKVNSARVRIKIIGEQGDSTSGRQALAWVCVSYPVVDFTALGFYQAVVSQQYARTTGGVFSYGGSNTKVVSYYMKHDSIVGSKSDTWDIGVFVTADSSAGYYMVLLILLQGNVPGVHRWVLEIDIFQYVTFFFKKNVVDA